MSEQNKLQEMIRTSLESLRAMVDANTVVGTPINTPSGTTVIPISKVSVGYASGGSEFGKTQAPKSFAGGGGTGLSVSPVCFLCVNAEGEVQLLPITTAPTDPVERVADLIEKTPDILSRIKRLFKKGGSDKDEVCVEEVAEAAAEAVREVCDKE